MIELNLPAVPFCVPSDVKFGLLVPSSKAIVIVGEDAPGAMVCEMLSGITTPLPPVVPVRPLARVNAPYVMELMCSCEATPVHVNFRLFNVIDDTVQVFVMLNVKLPAKLAPVPWNAGAGEAASCR